MRGKTTDSGDTVATKKRGSQGGTRAPPLQITKGENLNLFDEMDRDYEGLKAYGESSFEYLNRSARPLFSKTRQVLESWFSTYPRKEQCNFRKRFRSSERQSPFFEIFLHQLLLNLGCCVEIHPRGSDTTQKCPDFLVHSPAGSCFYMEATAVTGLSKRESSAQARMNDFYDALERMKSPNFWLDMELAGAPETPVPAKRLRPVLQQWLASLDPDDTARQEQMGGFEALPSTPFEHEGWEITFRAIPKPPELRGKAGIRPIGIQSDVPRWIDPGLAVSNAVRKKAGKYGKLPLPCVVAVNALDSSFFGGHRDAMRALFGGLGLQIRVNEDGTIESRQVRTPDGAWYGPSGPTYTRVSAALIATRLLPWSWPRAEIRLYHNPWAEKPYVGELTRLAQAIPAQDVMQWQEGESLADVFGVAPDWPGQR